MKRIALIMIVTLAIINFAEAQNTGQYYRQFFFNPYLFNPAFVGINKHSEINFVYRQQWAGFKDAPTITGVNFQYPTNGRVALGFALNSDKQVLLRNSTFSSTFGYEIPLSARQSLRAGLSAGIGLNTLDLNSDELNSNDPVLRNSGSNYYPIGNFGLLYTYSNLRVGIAFNDIFRSSPFESKAFTGFSFSSMQNRIYSLRYKFNVGLMENIAIEPYVLYHQSVDNTQNAWEATSLIYFKDKIWTGAGYNQIRGLAFFLGANVKEKFAFGYSYEVLSSIGTTSSHEFHLKIKIGRKKTPSVSKSSTPSVTPEDELDRDEREVEKEEKKTVSNAIPEKKDVKTITSKSESTITKKVPESKPSSVTVKTNAEPVVEKRETKVAPPATKSKNILVNKPIKSATFTRGHYVVVSAFKNLEHSKTYIAEMARKGYQITVSYNAAKNIYYAYVYSSFDLEDAKQTRDNYKTKAFKDAWIFSVQ